MKSTLKLRGSFDDKLRSDLPRVHDMTFACVAVVRINCACHGKRMCKDTSWVYASCFVPLIFDFLPPFDPTVYPHRMFRQRHREFETQCYQRRWCSLKPGILVTIRFPPTREMNPSAARLTIIGSTCPGSR